MDQTEQMDVEAVKPDQAVKPPEPDKQPKQPEPRLCPLVKRTKSNKDFFSNIQLKFIGLLIALMVAQTGFAWLIRSKVKNHQLVLTMSTTLVLTLFGVGIAVLFMK